MAEVEIDILLETRDAVKEIQKFQKQSEKSFKKVSQSVDKISSSFKDLGSNIVAIGGAIATGFAFGAVVDGINAVTEAAAVQEDAIKKLETSLKLAGDFSEEASQDFQDFASSLQAVTTVGDETSLELLALARNFTATNEEAKELTAAAVDLSAATGTSLESAVINLGKSLSGLAGELGESVPGFRDLSAEALAAGEGIQLVTERFGGAAAALRETFSGAVQSAQNSFGDFLEELGFAITQNAAVIAVLNKLSEAFSKVGSFVKENRDEIALLIKNAIVAAVRAFAIFAKSVVENFDTAKKTIGVFVDAVTIGFKFVQQGIDSLLLAFARLVEGVAKARGFVADLFGFDEAAKEAEQVAELYGDLGDSIEADIKERSKEIGTLFDEAIDALNAPEVSPENNALLATLELISNELDKIVDTAEDIDVSGARPGAPGAAAGPARAGAAGIGTGVGIDTLALSEGVKDAVLIGLEGVGGELAGRFTTALSDIAGRLGTVLVNGAKDFTEKSEEEQTKAAQAAAGEFVAGVGGAVTDIFLPGAGQFVEQFLALAQDPENFKAFIEGFVAALPDIIDAIVEGVPILVDALVENLPFIVDALIEGLPRIINAIIDALPDIIEVLVDNAPRFAVALIQALINAIPELWKALIDGLGRGLQTLFDNLIADLTGQGGIGGTLGQALGGDVGGALESIGSALGFQDGGVVPPGFPNDSFPARLTSGEMVLNQNQQRELLQPQMVTVNVTLNEDVLASTILELNRNNRRLA